VVSCCLLLLMFTFSEMKAILNDMLAYFFIETPKTQQTKLPEQTETTLLDVTTTTSFTLSSRS